MCDTEELHRLQYLWFCRRGKKLLNDLHALFNLADEAETFGIISLPELEVEHLVAVEDRDRLSFSLERVDV